MKVLSYFPILSFLLSDFFGVFSAAKPTNDGALDITARLDRTLTRVTTLYLYMYMYMTILSTLTRATQIH